MDSEQRGIDGSGMNDQVEFRAQIDAGGQSELAVNHGVLAGDDQFPRRSNHELSLGWLFSASHCAGVNVFWLKAWIDLSSSSNAELTSLFFK